MPLRVYDRVFGTGARRFWYVADPFRDSPEDAGAAVVEDPTPEARISRLHEARGYYERPPAFKRRFRVCKTAARVEDLDRDAVRALKPFIEQWEPEWVERVKSEWSSDFPPPS